MKAMTEHWLSGLEWARERRLAKLDHRSRVLLERFRQKQSHSYCQACGIVITGDNEYCEACDREMQMILQEANQKNIEVRIERGG